MIRKLRFSLVMSFFMVFAVTTFGQSRQEVTLDLFSPFVYDRYGAFYERLIKDNQGLSIGLAYDVDNIYFYQTFIGMPTESAKAHLLQLDLVYKFYFSKKRNNAGFFLGPLLGFESPIAEDKDLDQLYVEYYGREYKYDSDDLLKIGGALGYKYVLKERWVFEAHLAMFNYPLQLGGEFVIISIGSYYGLKVGYRF